MQEFNQSISPYKCRRLKEQNSFVAFHCFVIKRINKNLNSFFNEKMQFLSCIIIPLVNLDN